MRELYFLYDPEIGFRSSILMMAKIVLHASRDANDGGSMVRLKQKTKYCTKKGVRTRIAYNFGRRAPCSSVSQTLIFGRPKTTHRPKATHV